MPGPTKAELETRLRALEAENARLHDSLAAAESAAQSAAEAVAQSAGDDAPTAAPTGDATPVATYAPAPASSAGSHRGRAILGILLIVVGTLLAPLATVTGFAARQLSDTDVFVRTLAPLAEDPAVQALIIAEGSAAIDAALDTDALVEELLEAVIDDASTPRLANAADLLGPLLADQARVAIRSALTAVVESEAFATAWEESLRLTHRQMVSVLEADLDGAVTISDSGEVVISLQPILAELKPALVDAGFTLADAIPEVNASITVAEVPSIAKARLGYSLLLTTSTVLAWIAVGLVVVGVLVHPRRPRAVVVAGSLLLFTGTVLAIGIGLGGQVAAALVATRVPTDATAAIYGALTGETVAVMVAFAALGVIGILAGLSAGGSAAARAARRSGSGVLGRGTAALDSRGWRPEVVPTLLHRLPWLRWLVLGAIAVLLLTTLRPLSLGDVLLGTVILAAVAALEAVLRGPATPADAAETPEPDGLTAPSPAPAPSGERDL